MNEVQQRIAGTDKLLIGIVVGALILVGVAFAVTLLQPKPTYQPEDSPENIAHNYLFALQEEDYARAYGYLSPSLEGFPDSADEFAKDVEENPWVFRNDRDITLAIQSSRVTGDRATVEVRKTHFYGGGLFDTGQYIQEFEMQLRRENGKWLVTGADSYFAWCWDSEDGC